MAISSPMHAKLGSSGPNPWPSLIPGSNPLPSKNSGPSSLFLQSTPPMHWQQKDNNSQNYKQKEFCGDAFYKTGTKIERYKTWCWLLFNCIFPMAWIFSKQQSWSFDEWMTSNIIWSSFSRQLEEGTKSSGHKIMVILRFQPIKRNILNVWSLIPNSFQK